MKITFLGHSGYMIEEGSTALIFDYYTGQLPKLSDMAKLYVFASHVHPDHFNRKIFEWEKMYPDIQYVLSDDIKTEGPQGKVVYIGAEKEIMLDGLRISVRSGSWRGKGLMSRFCRWTRGRRISTAGDSIILCVIRIQNARFRCICGSSMIFAGNYWRIRCRSLTEIR